MPKFKLYTGLGGGFGGPTYRGTYEFKNKEEADREAYELAWEDYENSTGYYGLYTWEEIYQDYLESGIIDSKEDSETIDEAYLEQGENLIMWYVEEDTGELYI